MCDGRAPGLSAPDGATTRDGFYGGRLLLDQPARGHRAGTDAVLLAAAAPDGFAGLAYDVGAGVGAAGLGLALRCPAARVGLVERDPLSLRLAAHNARANGLAGRVTTVAGDLFALRPEAPAGLVLTNPPYHRAGQARPSPDPARAGAHVLDEGVRLADWLAACLRLLAPGGILLLIQAPAALPEALAALENRAGAVTVLGVHPRPGAPARRMLLRARKGSRAPLGLAAPLVLHGDDGAFTAEAERLHRGEAALDWGG